MVVFSQAPHGHQGLSSSEGKGQVEVEFTAKSAQQRLVEHGVNSGVGVDACRLVRSRCRALSAQSLASAGLMMEKLRHSSAGESAVKTGAVALRTKASAARDARTACATTHAAWAKSQIRKYIAVARALAPCSIAWDGLLGPALLLTGHS